METPCTCPDKGEAVLNPCPTHDAANVLELVLSNKVCVALCEVPCTTHTSTHNNQQAIKSLFSLVPLVNLQSLNLAVSYTLFFVECRLACPYALSRTKSHPKTELQFNALTGDLTALELVLAHTPSPPRSSNSSNRTYTAP